MKKIWLVLLGVFIVFALLIVAAGRGYFGKAPAEPSPIVCEIAPENAVIVIPEKPSKMLIFAAEELEKHLKLVCGKKIPIVKGAAPTGKYAFQLGVNPDKRQLKPEEAVWSVSQKGVVIFGDDDTTSKLMLPKRSGTLYALYDFLEDNFNFIWLYPGDKGIQGYTESPVLRLTVATGNWIPALSKREMRRGYDVPYRTPMPSAMKPTQKGEEKTLDMYSVWLKRQRMGSSESFSIRHAYTQWWNRFHKTHPDYFALRHTGKRELLRLKPSTVKLCVSNPAVADQIVADWMAQNPRPRFINVEENDWEGYCTCEKCRALDRPLPGEPTMDPKFIATHPKEEGNVHLTDRYVYLANEVLKRARKIDPNALVGMYAYGTHREPPRHEKVDPDMVLGVVTGMRYLDQARTLMKGWQKAGVKRIFLRPNDLHSNIVLPLGFEKQIYDHFDLACKIGAFGDDWDSMYGFWATTGITDYILARKHVTPEKSFEELEDEYASAFGSAAPEIKEYFRYWRHNIWEKRIMTNLSRLSNQGLYGNVNRGCVWYIKEYFFEEDFDQTDAILQKAAARGDLNPRQKQLVRELVISNQHNRMTYHAMGAPKDKKLEVGRELFAWRKQHKDDFPMYWMMVNFVEQRYGDVTGTGLASEVEQYSQIAPVAKKWHFKMDENDVGITENWGKTLASEFAKWSEIPIAINWERAGEDKSVPAELGKKLSKYDGTGWYATTVIVPPQWRGKEIYLRFGAVDEDARVFVNGEFVGERIAVNTDDWQKPFTIRVDGKINWDAEKQSVVVRVHDADGAGGIWKPVLLVVK